MADRLNFVNLDYTQIIFEPNNDENDEYSYMKVF